MVTEEERERLESLAHRSRSQPLLARRARVVLACAEGSDNKAVAKRLRCLLIGHSGQLAVLFPGNTPDLTCIDNTPPDSPRNCLEY